MDTITIEVEIVNETDKAIFVDSDGDRVWFPKSQIEIQKLDTDVASQNRAKLVIPRWLYKDKFPNDPL